MKYPVYAIRDEKVGFDTQLILQANESAAVRGFSYMVNNAQSITGFAPADFSLYQIGEFESDNGIIDPVVPIKFIVNGGSVFNEK